MLFGVRFMNSNYLKTSSATQSAFRVACGEMIISDRWYIHPEAVLASVKSGSASIETSSGVSNVEAGDIYFVAPNQKYKIVSSDDVTIQIVLLNLNNPTTITQEYIPQSVIRGLTSGNCTHFAVCPVGGEYNERITSAFDIIYEAETNKGSFFQLIVHGKMYEIYYLLFSSSLVKIFDVETQGKKYRALRRVTEYVNDNYCDNISLDAIAAETGLSRYYISHLFKELLNTTFVNYLNELRLNRAATLLTTTEIPVIEIAGLSGFNNISNFNRSFKMYFDTTPSKYRKAEKQLL